MTDEQTLITNMVRSAFACGDALPAGRGGHCDACTEWADPDEELPSEEDPFFEPPAEEDNYDPQTRLDPDETPGGDPWPPDHCLNCGGAHHIQKCVELLEAVANPGRAIFRHWHCLPKPFITAYRGYSATERRLVAEAYAAYVGGTCTAEKQLNVWQLAMDGPQLPARARP